ncbi:Hypothetical predicted protein [Cloeon dipterum]|uniref:Cullin family profile domain-containing protein n=1 Tax=Cloeon dipterum TaxID=197152 RepID=A0A8S1DQQ3_9INSE|nr:Hypothetical predicted protein [Cloeon dipterum]
MERKRDMMKCWTLQEKIDLQVDVARMSVYDKQLVELRRIMSSDAKCPVRDDCIDTIDLKDFTLDQLRLYVESRRINPSSTSSGSDSLMPLEKQAVQAPPDTRPNLSNFKDLWAQIEPDVLRILRSKTLTSYSFIHFMNSTIQIIQRESDNEFVEFIYAKARELLGAHVRNIMTSFHGMRNDCGLFLSNFNKQWALYENACNNLAQLYESAQENSSRIWSMSINDIGHRVWYNAMQEEHGFQEYLMKSLVNMVSQIRRGDQNEEIIPKMVLAVQNLSDIYNPTYLQESDERAFEDLLQEEFIEPVIKIYGEVVNVILTKNAPDRELGIMECVTAILKSDKVWIEAVFAEESVNDFFVDILEKYFEPYKPTILTNLDRLFEEDRYEALSHLYVIFKDFSDGLDMEILTSKFDAIVHRETNEIESKSAGTDMVEDLAKIYSKKFKMINNVFRGDINFLDLLNKAVAPILNKKTDPKTPCKSPEMLARLFDTLVRNKDLSETEILERFDNIGPVYKILLEKDVFERFHFLLTARRLRKKGYRSLELEKELLQRLPLWGIRDLTLTSNIMTMIKDVLISNNVLENYNTTKNDFGFVFTANIMKTQIWPIRSIDNTQIKLSGELKVALEKYESIHKHFFNNRKLIWNYLYSTGEIQINYSSNPYLLSMNTYQMAIMLLFEENNRLGFVDIKNTLAIPEETLVDQLACLVESELLIVHPMVFNATSQLSLNFEFRNKNNRVKIPSIPAHREAFLEKTQDMEVVLHQRHFIIRAAIVRFAKRNSPISHDNLLSGVRKMLEDKFELEIPAFERATADLINRKYLEEHLDDKKLYRYICFP